LPGVQDAQLLSFILFHPRLEEAPTDVPDSHDSNHTYIRVRATFISNPRDAATHHVDAAAVLVHRNHCS
jgi:hypothetical protein